jgi:hypothetical protein
MASKLIDSELDVPPNKKLVIIFSNVHKIYSLKKALKKVTICREYIFCIIEIKLNIKKPVNKAGWMTNGMIMQTFMMITDNISKYILII